MTRARRTVIGAWAGSMMLAGATGFAGANAGAGLFTPSVCLSPLVFGALILTPTATLSDYATQLIQTRINQ